MVNETDNEQNKRVQRVPTQPPKREPAFSAQTLAYLGDAVFELMVREWLIRDKNTSVREYNRIAKNYVSAQAQAKMYHLIYDRLSEEEQAILKRGRNLHPVTRAKNAEMSDYRHATGLEVLFGHLYANGEMGRLREVFEMCAAPPLTPLIIVKE